MLFFWPSFLTTTTGSAQYRDPRRWIKAEHLLSFVHRASENYDVGDLALRWRVSEMRLSPTDQIYSGARTGARVVGLFPSLNRKGYLASEKHAPL